MVTRYNSFHSFLGDEYPKLEFTVFGLLSVTAGLANLRLPETLGRPLPETIMDMILLGESQNKKIFFADDYNMAQFKHCKVVGIEILLNVLE